MVKVIGISGISGAGKTTLVKKLAATLNATALFWDDFDSISQSPEDYVEWYKTSRNYDDWKYDALAETLRKLKNGEDLICPATQKYLKATSNILFDAPLGYLHKATGQFIDILICLDIPLDIALARRLLRDYKDSLPTTEILTELEFYLTHSRPLFILNPEGKNTNYLIIDGSLSVDTQEGIVLNNLFPKERD